MSVICIDFDRTIHDMDHPVPGHKMGEPIPQALAAVDALVTIGHRVIVLTSQVNHGYIRKWLQFYGFPPLEVTNVKPVADVYIDDRAVRFEGNWRETMAEVGRVLS